MNCNSCPRLRRASIEWWAMAVVAFAIVIMAWPQPAEPAGGNACPSFSGRVLPEAHDGDTPKLLIPARVWRVDCPEAAQPYGEEARDFMLNFTWGKPVRLEPHGVSYDRPVVKVTTLVGGDLGLALVRAGLAWVEPRYNKADDYGQELVEAQAEARRERRGLWADEKPVAPWEWRRGRKAAAK